MGSVTLLLQILWTPFHLLQLLTDKLLSPLYLRLQGVQFDAGLVVSGYPVVRPIEGGAIRLGRGVKLYSRRRANPMQLNSPCTLWLSQPGATIRIGDDSAISGTVICAATSVEIGQRVMIGANAKLTDTDFHPVAAQARREHPTRGAVTKPVVIGDDVWIGMGAIILPGTQLGAGCVVSAGAVVSGIFPPHTVLAGNPARAVKKLGVETQPAS